MLRHVTQIGNPESPVIRAIRVTRNHDTYPDKHQPTNGGHMPDEPDQLTPDERNDIVPGYETDLSAVGTNREATDPDPRPWNEVHGLTEEEAEALTDDPA
jgi:hypothetical protein